MIHERVHAVRFTRVEFRFTKFAYFVLPSFLSFYFCLFRFTVACFVLLPTTHPLETLKICGRQVVGNLDQFQK